jgi:hypothetical protein
VTPVALLIPLITDWFSTPPWKSGIMQCAFESPAAIVPPGALTGVDVAVVGLGAAALGELVLVPAIARDETLAVATDSGTADIAAASALAEPLPRAAAARGGTSDPLPVADTAIRTAAPNAPAALTEISNCRRRRVARRACLPDRRPVPPPAAALRRAQTRPTPARMSAELTRIGALVPLGR